MLRPGAVLLVCLLVGLAAPAWAEAVDAPEAVSLADRAHALRSSGEQPAGPWVRCANGYVTRPGAYTMQQAPQKPMTFIVAAYLWASSIDGTSYADGTATDLDVPFSDLADKLDGAFMGYAELRYCRWSFHIDGSFVALEDTTTGPLGASTIETELDQTTVDFGVGYALLERTVGSAQWGSCCYPRMMTLDAVVGARYWNLEQDLTVTLPTGQLVRRDGSEDWWDPYVGARFRWQFAKRWGVSLYGDVGGFGIEDASELTWKLQALLRFHVTRGFFVGVGYRALDVDRVTGTGATRNGVDATYHGPILGAGFRF